MGFRSLAWPSKPAGGPTAKEAPLEPGLGEFPCGPPGDSSQRPNLCPQLAPAQAGLTRRDTRRKPIIVSRKSAFGKKAWP